MHLRGIRAPDMRNCNQTTISDAGLAHLVGIQTLRGVRVLNMGHCWQLTDAAFAHLKGIHTLLMWC